MADLAAANVTITIEKKVVVDRQRRYRVKITFGDGALTYPASGVPLPAASSFGMIKRLDYLVVTDKNDAVGLDWKYDQSNRKLRAWQTALATHGHDLLVKGGQAAATTNRIANYATAILGKEEATDATYLEADAATKGGALSKTLAAAAMTELGNVTVAAQTLFAEAVGW